MDGVSSKTKIRITIAILLYNWSPFATAADLSVSATARADFDDRDFASVEALYAGPWHQYQNVDESGPMETPRSERWRLLVIPPTEEGDTMLVLEKIVMGAEGCCVRVAERRTLDISGNRGFVFEQWQGPHSFKFNISSKRYVISWLDGGHFEVVPQTN